MERKVLPPPGRTETKNLYIIGNGNQQVPSNTTLDKKIQSEILLTTKGASNSVYTFSGANYESVWKNLSS